MIERVHKQDLVTHRFIAMLANLLCHENIGSIKL